MAIVLALVSAAAWGSGDFLGGFASRRIDPRIVTASAQVIGLVGLFIVVIPFASGPLAWGDVVLSVAAGLSGLCGLLVFYKALASGPMGPTAAVTGVFNVAAPVIIDWLSTGTIDRRVVLGLALAVAAITMVSLGGEDEPSDAVAGHKPDVARNGPERGPGAVEGPGAVKNEGGSMSRRWQLTLAALSGTLFGLFFVFISRADEASELSPLLVSRATSSVVTSLLAFAVLRRATRASVAGSPARAGRVPARSYLAAYLDTIKTPGSNYPQLLIACGTCDVAANSLYLGALRVGGPFAAISVIAALYPVFTVLWGLAVLHEKLDHLSIGGIVLSLLSVGVIAA